MNSITLDQKQLPQKNLNNYYKLSDYNSAKRSSYDEN